MTYREEIEAAEDDYSRMKIVEAYTLKFRQIMDAAGLEPVVGEVNGRWQSFDTIAAPDLVETMSAIEAADPELGKAARELVDDILECANYLAGQKEPAPEEDVDGEPGIPDLDADTAAWVSPEPVEADTIAAWSDLMTDWKLLEEGKIKHVAPVGDGVLLAVTNHEYVESVCAAVFGYHIIPLADFRKMNPDLEPAHIDEVAEREYNPKYGYFHHARMKLGRKVVVPTRYVCYATADYLESNGLVETEFEPTTNSIELDEEPPASEPLEEQERKIQEAFSEPAPADELERLCRLLFAVKEEKSQTAAEFNEQIKQIESEIQALIRRRDADRYQHRLPLEGGVPDAEAEKALDAAAEESQDEPSEGPETAPKEEASADTDNSEPDEKPAENEPGEAWEPAVRESDKDGKLLCVDCGALQPFWSFELFEGGKKGFVCAQCRA